MRILLTNDDGIHAEGLAVMERIASGLSQDVWVVAPEFDQSGLAHSLSLNNPLRLRQVSERKFALRGTPSDCIIMAVRRLMAETPPDLILSGVNAGQNAADDVTYSGTVAGAIEGTLLGIPSIALSQSAIYSESDRRVPFEVAETHAPRLIERLRAFGFPPGILFNVNFPSCPPDKVTGDRVTVQGKVDHRLHISEHRDGRGLPYFWLAYRPSTAPVGEGTDMAALEENAISVTPLRLDLTAHEVADPLRRALASGPASR